MRLGVFSTMISHGEELSCYEGLYVIDPECRVKGYRQGRIVFNARGAALQVSD